MAADCQHYPLPAGDRSIGGRVPTRIGMVELLQLGTFNKSQDRSFARCPAETLSNVTSIAKTIKMGGHESYKCGLIEKPPPKRGLDQS